MASVLNDQSPQPEGELISRFSTQPAHTNVFNDIYAGWLIGQMDLAGAYLAQRLANGRVATVATGGMVFLRPVPLGAQVTCYANCLESGRSSIRIQVEVWIQLAEEDELAKVTEGEFVFVAIDDQGRTRLLN